MDKTEYVVLVSIFVAFAILIFFVWLAESTKTERRHKAENACQEFKLVLVEDNKAFCQVSPTTVEIRDFK